MDARICTNPKCRTILPGHTCPFCQQPSEPLPSLSLTMIGIDATAHLIHTQGVGYSLLVTTPTRNYPLSIPLAHLTHSAQPCLPFTTAAPGPIIMDSLKHAAALIKTKNTGHWAGWIIYLLELLQDNAATASFQDVLKDLQHDIATNILEGEDNEPMYDATERREREWPKAVDDPPTGAP